MQYKNKNTIANTVRIKIEKYKAGVYWTIEIVLDVVNSWTPKHADDSAATI